MMRRETIRIAEFVRLLDAGGIESFVVNNISRMERSGLRFDFIVTREKDEFYDNMLREMNVKKRVIPLRHEYSKNKILKVVDSFLKSYIFFKANRYDIIHFHAISPGIASAAIVFAARLAGIKKRIIHSHMGQPTNEIVGVQRIKWIIGRYFVSMNANYYFACSDMAERYAFSPMAVKRRGCLFIKNGIDSKKYKYDPIMREEYRKALSINDSCVIGCVARFVDFKNHVFMVQILKEALKLRSNIVLVFAGGIVEGEEKTYEKILDTIKRERLEDKVLLLGTSKDVPKVLNAMDVYLMPSKREGFSISAVEAQCAGLKLVASDRVSKMTCITDNYITVPLSESAKTWAKIVVTCNDNYQRYDKSEMIKRKGFDIDQTAMELRSNYLRIYKER